MMEEGKKIMVVDDSSTMRQFLKMVLQRHLRCVVTEAQDGIDASEKMEAVEYDLIITDVNMPRMDGLSLVQRVRQERKSSVPIIIVTTKGGENDRDRGMELGANSYITKPISGGSLVKAVKSLVP